MENKISGLHHITAIAGDARHNYEFYTKVLGLRLVKKTVNFDDPGTYHFYFGDKVGTPGTILTFFPWQGVKKGSNGTGMATEIGYAVPVGSLSKWQARFAEYQVSQQSLKTEFGQFVLYFEDPDGLVLKLVEVADDNRTAWTANGVGADMGIKGFHSVALTLRKTPATEQVLQKIFGYKLDSREDNRSRFITDAVETANVVDLIEEPRGQHGINAGGTNHHVAFRVKDEETLMLFREKVISAGLTITEKIDRNYFYSLYFREPGGVLFEIATDNPGFATDESEEELGANLMLPEQYESLREKLNEVLPVID